MEHEHVLEQIPAYALGALDAEDVLQIRAHIERCAACRAELLAYQNAASMLALAAPQQEPPAGLKQQIMKKAALSPRKPAAGSFTVWRSLADRLYRLAPAWGLASLALVFLLVISNIWLWQRVVNLESKSKFQVVALAGTEVNPQASGVLVIGSDGMEGTLVVEHLPSLDAARQYQLWLIQDGKRTSGGVFSVDEGGYATLQIDSPASLLSFDAFGVTIEPYGGSSGPTGDKVLGGEL